MCIRDSTKTADGLTITCSEVYANSQAIYVTMQFKSDKPFPETETGAESGTPVSYTHLDVYKRQGDGIEKKEENFAEEVAKQMAQ